MDETSAEPRWAKPGDILAGKYRVRAVLGAGGMGFVVSADHLQLGDKVAIKFLLPELASNQEIRARFLREARVAVRVKSEHVVRVSDVGELDEGVPYMVMEHLEGHALDDLLSKQGPLPVGTAVEFVLQACEAIAEAHALGIIHRDLKPSNLFLTHRADGSTCVKVLDFGISKETATGANPGALTTTHQMLGSPQYMSPEQLRASRDVDARTDVWAMGVVLYQLLSARPPFEAESIPELCLKILQDQPVPLSQQRPEVPATLSAVVESCLEKDRTRRMPSIGTLVDALRAFAPPQALVSADRVRRMSQLPMPVALAATALAETGGGASPAARPRGRLVPTIGFSAVAVAAALSWWLVRGEPQRPTTPLPAATTVATPVTPAAAVPDAGPARVPPAEVEAPPERTAASTKRGVRTRKRPPRSAPARKNPLVDMSIK